MPPKFGMAELLIRPGAQPLLPPELFQLPSFPPDPYHSGR